MRYSRLSAALALCFVSVQANAEVRVEGEIEHGVFVSNIQNIEPGQRVLTRSDQKIEPTEIVPAKLGTKFGMRYRLTGKTVSEQPLTLLYLTPGVVTPDGKRHDKFVVTQKMEAGAPLDVMAFEFTEPYEIVKGEWQLMVFQEDRKLLEQRFEVR
jgi:hypothetical protein